MKCTNCGANFEKGANECPFCGSAINMELSFDPPRDVEVMVPQTAMNPLLDKEYNFSGNDLVVRGRWGVKTNIKVGEDRLYIDTYPAKKNVIPAVMLEDIMAIDDSFYMRTANIVIGALGLVFGCMGAIVCLIFPIFVLLLYRERKIKIHLRNGNVLTVYSGDKALANQFVEDMKKITKIRQ